MKISDRNAAAADHTMYNVDPDANDETIAGITADYPMIGYRATRHLWVLHDVCPSTQHNIERIRKRFERPYYQPVGPT